VGAELVPISFVSVGIQGRALLAIFDVAHTTNPVPSGVAPGFSLGFTLGLHLPTTAETGSTVASR
jgi:hypothetical protein